MKRTAALIGLLFIGLLLLFNPQTGVVTAGTSMSVASSQQAQTTSAPPTPATSAGGQEPPSTTTSSTTSTTASPTITVLGQEANTRFGPFQVEIVVDDGVLVGINTVEQPSHLQSRRINDYVIPFYKDWAISAQSANIDAISGATITWQAWTASLESAMQEAGL
jgi:uncharacterized protein with FMN-binding domain